MLKIILEKWDKNKVLLEKYLTEEKGLDICEYIDLVKITFDSIINANGSEQMLDISSITEIDDGRYEGTKLYLIPFDTNGRHNIAEYEYLMTHVNYGSCSGCDCLQYIQSLPSDPGILTKDQVNQFMILCKDILTNTIKPYNYGWRNNSDFDQVEEKE